MPLEFDTLERRILGVLVEKQMAVPETYPLTLNALVAGCNQKSNRDPQMSVEHYEVEGALHSLMDNGWVVRVEKAGGRSFRYEHRMREPLAVHAADLALLAELMNRGPQTTNELKTRASRMHPFATPGDVEARLNDLAERPVPYVRLLEKRPGERYPRWTHLLAKPTAGDVPPLPPLSAVETAPTPAAVASPPPTPAPAPSQLEVRVAQLEREVSDLRARLARLET